MSLMFITYCIAEVSLSEEHAVLSISGGQATQKIGHTRVIQNEIKEHPESKIFCQNVKIYVIYGHHYQDHSQISSHVYTQAK